MYDHSKLVDLKVKHIKVGMSGRPPKLIPIADRSFLALVPQSMLSFVGSVCFSCRYHRLTFHYYYFFIMTFIIVGACDGISCGDHGICLELLYPSDVAGNRSHFCRCIGGYGGDDCSEAPVSFFLRCFLLVQKGMARKFFIDTFLLVPKGLAVPRVCVTPGNKRRAAEAFEK